MALPLGSGATEKRCRKCGLELSHVPRVKDSKGRYYCKTCYEATRALKLQKAAAIRKSSEPRVEVLPADADLSQFDDLLDVGSSTALPTMNCPGCGCGVPTDAVICTECGYDRRTGRTIGEESSPPTDSASQHIGRTIIARKSSSTAAVGAAPFWQTGWFFGVGSLVFFVAFYVAASQNTALAAAFQIAQTVYSLAASIWLLVVAFQESAAQGCLCLFTCGFYSLYYGFVRQDNMHLKFALGVSIVVTVLGAILGGQMLFTLLSQQQGGT